MSQPVSIERWMGRLLASGGDRLSDGQREEFRWLLEHFAGLLSGAFDVPVCMVSGFRDGEQCVAGGCGIGAGSTFPLQDSLCRHPFESGQPLIIPDASVDPRFAANPHVTGGIRLRFYAGVPIPDEQGGFSGVLCLIDTRPRGDFPEQQRKALVEAAKLVGASLRMFMKRDLDVAERELFMSGPTAAVVWEIDDEDVVMLHWSGNLARIIGGDLVRRLDAGEPFDAFVHPDDRIDLSTALRSHRSTGLLAYEQSFRVNSPDGDVRWLRHSTRLATRPEGGRTRVFGYLTDETRQKRLETIVAGTKDRLALAIQSARLGTWDLDMRTQVRALNPRAAEIIGFPLDEVDPHQSFWLDRVHPADRATLDALIDAEDRPDEVTSIEYRVRHRLGHYVWVQSFGKVVEFDSLGRSVRAVGTLTDISDRKEEETQRARQRGLLDVLNRAHSGFLLTRDLHDACESLFEPLLRLTESRFGFIGIMRQGNDGQPFLLVPTISNISWDDGSRALHESHRDRGVGLRFTNLDNLFGHVVVADTIVCTNDPSAHPASRGFPPGHPRLYSFLGLPMRFDGRVMGMIALGNRPEGYDASWIALLEPLASTLGALVHARDLDEARRRAELALALRASSDALTGLANRQAFIDRCLSELRDVDGKDGALHIAIIDLDHFKTINDTRGHAAGDATLRHFADVARRCIRETDVIARIGGEEFGVLLHGGSSEEAASSLHRLRTELAATTVPWESEGIRVTFSAGLAQCPAGSTDLDAWMATADRALYEAKAQGRDAIRVAGESSRP